jgi:hypothetical protein
MYYTWMNPSNHAPSPQRSTNFPWLSPTENSQLNHRAEQSRSLLPATSRHAHTWHRAPLGPMAIYLFSVKTFVLFCFVAPFVFKITPLHRRHGKQRLPLLWMHVYSCVALQQIYCISLILLGTDHIENSFLSIVASSCLQSCCLATRWSNPLQYCHIIVTRRGIRIAN